MSRTRLNPALAKAIKAAGGVSALARALGIKHPAILQWGRIPANRIVDIERVTGVPREELRPDLYRR
jgi:DNA-binding transcriptional regulator YdaS (Cro superfamily)